MESWDLGVAIMRDFTSCINYSNWKVEEWHAEVLVFLAPVQQPCEQLGKIVFGSVGRDKLKINETSATCCASLVGFYWKHIIFAYSIMAGNLRIQNRFRKKTVDKWEVFWWEEIQKCSVGRSDMTSCLSGCSFFQPWGIVIHTTVYVDTAVYFLFIYFFFS